jgi:hypothetical protein
VTPELVDEQPTLPPPAAPAEITEPGVYDMPAERYHRDPVAGGSLSSTGARKLLPPSCPALFAYDREHGQEPRDVFDFGSAAHLRVLGVGPELVEVDADNWLTKAAKQQRDEARERGAIPLLTKDLAVVDEMAAALAVHPFAGKLFAPGTGRAEQVLIWQDKDTGVRCRAMVDWLRHPTGGRFILPDYKTCASAAPAKVERSIADYGYHVQGAWNLAGCRALGLADDTAEFLLVMQEKRAPYLVTVVQPDPTAMRMGAIRMRQALDLYAECTASGRWPGYADDVVLAELPPWETRELKGEVW